MAERQPMFLVHLLTSCAVFQVFDLAALVAILEIDAATGSAVLACDAVEPVDADLPMYRLKPGIAQALIERLRTTRAQDELPLVLLSFMSESRRLENSRMKQELRVRLRYASVESGLRAS